MKNWEIQLEAAKKKRLRVWEVWRADDGTESATFLVTDCPDETYRLLTHTVYDVPMTFVASFAEGNTRRAFDAGKAILDLL